MARQKSTTGIMLAGGALLTIVLTLSLLPGKGEAPPSRTAPTADVQFARASGLEYGPSGVAGLAEDDWVARTAEGTGIPERALRAYGGVDVAFAADLPGCRLDWATLAGIGYVESRHGLLLGGQINEDGQQTPPIVGIPLDGTRTAEVPDTDGGVLDGDTEWDRAVGPMQFIPSTWGGFGADGNLDGIEDPQNIDDAALAAARLLCRVGGDLGEPDNWIAAVDSYNRSVEYNNEVASAVDRYRTAAGRPEKG
ncbi:hypothetical protein [Flaviflexus huanghaiensis]|uniref:hypothetical protein n=1 Tax=Flaviflexus huanghaiensis TaxID=1111473 RepID=UPI0015FDF237|nr:hypothetical protein [Flaviflexus huanghaiensis]